MAIYLIRHGETDGNKHRVVQRPETPLNVRGLAQAERLGLRLRAAELKKPRILASDLSRAHRTAEAAALALSLEIEPEPGLQERNFGDLRGRAYEEIDADIMAEDYEPPNGESWPVFHDRVSQMWQRRLPELLEAEGDVLLFTHGLVKTSFAQKILCLEDHQRPDHWGNTAVTVFEAADPKAASLVGCTSHLDGDLKADLSAGKV